MPKGVPVATVAIGNAFNAGLLAVQILAQSPEFQDLSEKLENLRAQERNRVLAGS
jgi:5-(carboxyamino)imidazole ribonucleotide mutase